MNIKELFEKSAENGSMTYEQFEAAAKAANAKFADLNEGAYVSKSKYASDLASKDDQIKTLNDTITNRDTDLTSLKTKLEAAGADADKLATLTNDFTALQTKYTEDTKNYQAQLSKQAYDFAVREHANTKKFTSEAAKREYIRSMSAENLKLKDDVIIGAEDFDKLYMEKNADSFVTENPNPNPPTPTASAVPLPTFVAPTSSGSQPPASNAFAEAFHFAGVRPIPKD